MMPVRTPGCEAGAGGLRAGHDFQGDKVHGDGDREAKDDGADEGWPDKVQRFDRKEREDLHAKVLGSDLGWEMMRMTDDVIADEVLPPQDNGDKRQENVMKGDGKDGGYLAESEEPCRENGEQGLEAPERGKP